MILYIIGQCNTISGFQTYVEGIFSLNNLSHMKTLFVLSWIMFFSMQPVQPQDTLHAKRAQPMFWIHYIQDSSLAVNNRRLVCRLYATADSSLIVSKTSMLAEYARNDFKTIMVPVGRIHSIDYRNTNNIFIGMLAGGLTGLAVGFIIGTEEEDDPADTWLFYMSAEEKAAGDMVMGTLIGLGLGTLLGTIRITIPIRGNQSSYVKNRGLLDEKSVVKKYNKP